MINIIISFSYDNNNNISNIENVSNILKYIKNKYSSVKLESSLIECENISISKIKKTVCEVFSIPLDIILSKSRKKEIVEARQIIQYFANKKTKNTYEYIGKMTGLKNYATVIHSCKQVQNFIDTDKMYKEKIEFIEKLLKQ